jgi:hypothetical protein
MGIAKAHTQCPRHKGVWAFHFEGFGGFSDGKKAVL